MRTRGRVRAIVDGMSFEELARERSGEHHAARAAPSRRGERLSMQGSRPAPGGELGLTWTRELDYHG